MKLLSKTEQMKIEKELDIILGIAAYVCLDTELRDRANELIRILDSSYHTEVNFELQVINGGKKWD